MRTIFFITCACLILASCAGVSGNAEANNNGGSITANVLRFP